MPIKTDSPSLYAAMREDYNVHSKLQRSSVEASKSYIELGVNSYRGPYSSNNTITIADFGSSVGANSSRAMSIFVDALRAKFGFEATKSITVVHNDLPQNSWTALFNYIYNDNESYAYNYEGVFSLASSQTFYKQILPANSLHFGYSNMAIHWLSEMPAKISNHCYPMFASNSEERDLFKKVADRDWQNFLTARSVELVQGGVLVIHCLAMRKTDNETVISDVLRKRGRLAVDAMYLSAKGLVERGLITEDELLNFNVRIYVRDYDDVTDRDLLNSLGFEVISADLTETRQNPIYKAYQIHQDVERFANESCDMMAAATEPTFLQAIAETRSNEEKKTICSAFWDEYRSFIKERPDEFNLAASEIYLVLRKK